MLRLKVAAEAETAKYLCAALNEVAERVHAGETNGEIARADRRAWFEVETSGRQEIPLEPVLSSEMTSHEAPLFEAPVAPIAEILPEPALEPEP